MGSALFFISAALTRKVVVVYTQGIVLFVAYLIGVMLTQETSSHLLAVLFDPFSFRTSKIVTELWSVDEINEQLLLLDGLLFFNRVFWVVVGIIILYFGVKLFNFERDVKPLALLSKVVTFFNGKLKSNVGVHVECLHYSKMEPGNNDSILIFSFIEHSLFYFRSIVTERSFYGIAFCGALIILINSISLGVAFGVESLPLTYLIIEDLQETSVYFFLILLVFYAGQLIWRERELKLALVMDATPVGNLILVGAKYAGLMLVFMLLLAVLMTAGLLFQVVNGFYQFDFSVYAIGFVIEMSVFLGVYTAVAIFLQVVVNQKYVAHILFLFIFIAMQALGPLGYGYGLWTLGGPGTGIYSEMNGYNNSMVSFSWFSGYWLLFSAIMVLLSGAVIVRGVTHGVFIRLKQGVTPYFRTRLFYALLAFSLCGVYIFYNTNVLNINWSVDAQEEYRANYELELKQFEYRPQTKLSTVDLAVEFYPSEKGYEISGVFLLTNATPSTVEQIHVQNSLDNNVILKTLKLEDGVFIDSSYQQYGYWILYPSTPIPPGASIELSFQQEYVSQGFVEDPDTRVVENGIFITNDHLPTLGYNPKYELVDQSVRESYGLPARRDVAEVSHPVELTRDRSGADADLIEFAATIGTDSDQTPIAPGSLVNSWSENGRRYAAYQSEVPIINFYALLSGRYVKNETKWSGNDGQFEQPVALNIYHHPGHLRNLDRMQRAMQESLSYFTTAFGPYPYGHLRIVEFPRYEAFAQSFPGTIPFSEAVGFVMNIDDATDVDMAFFITAHEVAHQWWGMKLQAANVEGKHLILESLAQYSALMVFKEVYGKEKTLQLLRREQEIYLRERKEAEVPERPLVKVDGSSYLYYSKGIVSFYVLSEMVGEAKVNRALKCFLDDWGISSSQQRVRYATAEDLLTYLRAEVPDDQEYLVSDLFEKVSSQYLDL